MNLFQKDRAIVACCKFRENLLWLFSKQTVSYTWDLYNKSSLKLETEETIQKQTWQNKFLISFGLKKNTKGQIWHENFQNV